MNSLERNGYTDTWRAFGESIARPRALLVVSAHWYTNATAVTAMPQPRTIHDFYGFPDELFAVDYPAPGAPDVAQLVADTIAPQWVGLDHDTWGLDHGTWSVLVHAFPDADVPVVQLSINALQPMEYHLDLGARLAPLLDDDIAVVGSGNVVHNLGRIAWNLPDGGFDWSHRFNDAAIAQLSEAPGDVLQLAEHPDFDAAVPTPDHFLPLVYVAGLAAATGATPGVLVDGYTYGSVSMTCFTIDGHPAPAGEQPATAPPPTSDAPPEQTNL
jgi:4,5-DOPA dioxygenase extradiol